MSFVNLLEIRLHDIINIIESSQILKSIEYGDLIMDKELENSTETNQQEIPNVVLTLNLNDVNLVLNALQELPHKIVDKVLQNIFAQAQLQLRQKQ
jgi:hypothetical protein